MLTGASPNPARPQPRAITSRLELLLEQNDPLPLLPILPSLSSTLDNANNSIYHHLCAYNNKLLHLILQERLFLHELNVVNSQGLKPLDVAAMYCSSDLVEKMMGLGAQGHLVYWATRGGSDFIEYEPEYDHVDQKGNSAVHFAAQNDLPHSLRRIYLRTSMTELTRRNNAGLSPLAIAIDSLSYSAAEYLLGVVSVGTLQQHQLDLIEQSSSPYLKSLFNREKQSYQRSMQRLRASQHHDSLEHGQHHHQHPQPSLPELASKVLKMARGRLLLFLLQVVLTPLFSAWPLTFSLPLILIVAVWISTILSTISVSPSTPRNFTFKSVLLDTMVRWGKRHLCYCVVLAVLSIEYWAVCLTLKQDTWFCACLRVVSLPLALCFTSVLVVHLVCVRMGVMPAQLLYPLQCRYLLRTEGEYTGYFFKRVRHEGPGDNWLQSYLNY